MRNVSAWLHIYFSCQVTRTGCSSARQIKWYNQSEVMRALLAQAAENNWKHCDFGLVQVIHTVLRNTHTALSVCLKEIWILITHSGDNWNLLLHRISHLNVIYFYWNVVLVCSRNCLQSCFVGNVIFILSLLIQTKYRRFYSVNNIYKRQNNK